MEVVRVVQNVYRILLVQTLKSPYVSMGTALLNSLDAVQTDNACPVHCAITLFVFLVQNQLSVKLIVNALEI